MSITTNVVLEPAAQDFAEATANPPYLFDRGPVEGRNVVDEVQSGEIEKPDVEIQDTTIPASGEVSIRILRPKGATGPLPVILYTHGAGWVFGNAHTHDRLIRELADGTGTAVVFTNYSLSPVSDATFDTDSYHQFAENYFLRRDAMHWFWDQYTTDEDQRNEVTASPLRATTEQLDGLPKALVITAEADVLRDEGEAYGRKLREAGVDVTSVRYEGIIHDFMMLNALRGTNAAQAAITQAVGYLREALS